MQPPIIIVGTGLAGYQLAREFRKLNPQAPLLLITADQGDYYSKPALSTAFKQGKTSNTLITATAASMSSQLKAPIMVNSLVQRIDPNNKAVYVNDKAFSYEKLILAWGAEVIKPPLDGEGAADVLSINHIYHYSTFQTLIPNKKIIAILGAGLIGSEFANDLSHAGFKVHVISPAKAPLDLLVPEAVGKILQSALIRLGVMFHFETTVKTVNKTSSGYTLMLSNGNSLEVDFVLSAIGLKPHTKLAEDAHIKINRGILVNRYLETSVSCIYALGDCAEVEGHVLPYIAPMLNCARALAQTLNGTKTAVSYPAMPIIVKTPAHPIAVCPPPRNLPGDWQIEKKDDGTYALFYAKNGQLYGFVLTEDAVKNRAYYVKQLPSLL